MDLPDYLVFKRPNELDEFGYHLTKKKLMLHSSYTLIPSKEINKEAIKYSLYVFLLGALIIGLNSQDRWGYIKPILQIISGFFILFHIYNAYLIIKLKKLIDKEKISYFTFLQEDVMTTSEFSEFIYIRKARIEIYELLEGAAGVLDLETKIQMLQEKKFKENEQMFQEKKFKEKDL